MIVTTRADWWNLLQPPPPRITVVEFPRPLTEPPPLPPPPPPPLLPRGTRGHGYHALDFDPAPEAVLHLDGETMRRIGVHDLSLIPDDPMDRSLNSLVTWPRRRAA